MQDLENEWYFKVTLSTTSYIHKLDPDPAMLSTAEEVLEYALLIIVPNPNSQAPGAQKPSFSQKTNHEITVSGENQVKIVRYTGR